MTVVSAEPQPMLRIEHLSKYFGGAVALEDVSLDIRAGEIHGLVGQNGSGKSTLIKCLSGYYHPDSRWVLTVGDQSTSRPLRPGDSAALGISFVHQDLGVLPDLTVLENLMLMQMASDRRVYIPWARERRDAEHLFGAFGLALDPRAKLGTLRPVEQAQVAIIRALIQLRRTARSVTGSGGVLVLDEATTFLDKPAQQSLHELLRSIVADGAAVLFVSHDVGEILGLANRITVLRDGRLVRTVSSAEVTHDDLVELIISGMPRSSSGPIERSQADGAAADSTLPRTGSAKVPVAGAGDREMSAPGRSKVRGDHVGGVEVEGLNGEYLTEVAFRALPSEIIGFTGIVGSGWEFVLEHLYGARGADSGTLRIDGRSFDLRRMTPTKALGLGMVFVPADRQAHGIVAELSLQENVMLPVLDSMFKRGLLSLRQITARCREILRKHTVQPSVPTLQIGLLSGGNQQKALLAKWLQLSPPVILLNQPTQGVDVGSRQVIYDIVRAAAAAGAVVLYASGDWEEVSKVANRVVVVADGRVTTELSGAELTLDRVAQEAFRGTRRSADLSNASLVLKQTGR